MRVLLSLGIGAAVACGVAAAFLWQREPSLAFETVSGYPQRVYYRNAGLDPVRVVAVNATTALSIDKPFSDGEIEKKIEAVKAQVKTAVTIVRPADFMWFIADDPDELAWAPAKTERTTWLYVFAVVEMPGRMFGKWISELCIVAKTGEPFARCQTHNDVYAAM